MRAIFGGSPESRGRLKRSDQMPAVLSGPDVAAILRRRRPSVFPGFITLDKGSDTNKDRPQDDRKGGGKGGTNDDGDVGKKDSWTKDKK